jgi:peroxiredoxin
MKILAAILFSLAANAFAVENGKLAPAFALEGASGKTVSLTALKGKTVVLEWLNHGCPFVRKHYDSNNMQALQKKYKAQGVVWLSIVSSAPGKQGHVDAKGAKADITKYKSEASDVLLDTDGTVGRAFGAKVTPHMYIINKDGLLVYQGAIDSIRSADAADIPKSKNYVALALDATLAGKAVAEAKTEAYGCGVKY